MPIDRAAALRNAEKLLRQGKFDLAIAEYLRIVEDQPGDWSTTNLLGDLYVRAGRVDSAVEQFTRIADGLYAEGFLPKAAAVYKKILKLQPNAEHAMLQAGEIAARLGLLADARTLLQSVVEQRRTRGDTRGVAEVRVRLGTLEPSDYEGRLVAASARVELGDAAGAVSDLKVIATELGEKGGRAKEVVAALREAVRLAPEDTDLKGRLARALVELGDTTAAAEYLTEESAGADVRLLMTLVEVRLRSGRIEEALTVGRRILNEDPTRRTEMASLGWTIAADMPEAGFHAVELVADDAVAQLDWATASATLQEFVTRIPNHVPALMRLIEVCVDGDLETTMHSAQAQLCDAYLATGAATEAGFIAEDLIAREPREPAHVERLRRALILTGEQNPDAVIAERLSRPSASMNLNLSQDGSAEAVPEVPSSSAEVPSRAEDVSLSDAEYAPPLEDPPPTRPIAVQAAARRSPVVPANRQFALSDNAIDIDTALSVEIDLSVVLDDIKSSVVQLSSRPRESAITDVAGATPGSSSTTTRGAPPAGTPSRTERVLGTPPVARAAALEDSLRHPVAADRVGDPGSSRGPQAPSPANTDLDGVFEQLRGEVARRSSIDLAQAEFQRGLGLLESGDVEGGIQVLKAAWTLARVQTQE